MNAPCLNAVAVLRRSWNEKTVNTDRLITIRLYPLKSLCTRWLSRNYFVFVDTEEANMMLSVTNAIAINTKRYFEPLYD